MATKIWAAGARDRVGGYRVYLDLEETQRVSSCTIGEKTIVFPNGIDKEKPIGRGTLSNAPYSALGETGSENYCDEYEAKFFFPEYGDGYSATVRKGKFLQSLRTGAISGGGSNLEELLQGELAEIAGYHNP